MIYNVCFFFKHEFYMYYNKIRNFMYQMNHFANLNNNNLKYLLKSADLS